MCKGAVDAATVLQSRSARGSTADMARADAPPAISAFYSAQHCAGRKILIVSHGSCYVKHIDTMSQPAAASSAESADAAALLEVSPNGVANLHQSTISPSHKSMLQAHEFIFKDVYGRGGFGLVCKATCKRR